MDELNAESLRTTDRSEYDALCRRCLSAIEKAHKLHKTWVVFEIPKFVFGRPFFDQTACVETICDMLVERKFNFKVMRNNPPSVQIFITWVQRKSLRTARVSEAPVAPPPLPVRNENDTSGSAATSSKRVAFSDDALSNLEQTFLAMKNSGKLTHLKSFQPGRKRSPGNSSS